MLTDGIWRSTGNGIWLSPLEGDAVAEYAEQAVWHVLEELSGVPRDRLPEPGEIRFGQAEPYCVRWETGEEQESEFGENISPVIARLTTVLASQVWWKRSVPVGLRGRRRSGRPARLVGRRGHGTVRRAHRDALPPGRIRPPAGPEQAQSEPSLDFAWGPVPDGGSSAREWER